MPGLGALCTLTILMAGGRQVQTGELTLGAFTAFLWYLGMLLWPVREAGNLVNLFQRGFAGCDRLFELLDTVPEIADPPAPDAPRELAGADRAVARQRCRYPGAARPALEDVSLAIAAGEMVGIVGRVGAGKSTLLRLLVRLLEPSQACDRDRRLRARPPPARASCARASRSCRRKPSCSPRACARTWPTTTSRARRPRCAPRPRPPTCGTRSTPFPRASRRWVGERGVTLSGGQKQRVTLARSFVRDTPVLLLDDAFSSLDAETEARVLRRLRELRRGRTTLLVSHRVSAVREADRIVVLEAGRVLEVGKPRRAAGAGRRLRRARARAGPARAAAARARRQRRAGRRRDAGDDHSVFDAELAGRGLRGALVRRLLAPRAALSRGGVRERGVRARRVARWRC